MSTWYGDRDGALAIAAHAGRTDAYAAEWRAAGADPARIDDDAFARLPFLSKQALIDGCRGSAPYGGRLGVDPVDLTAVFVAPGPIYMPYTADDLERLFTASGRAFRSCGLGPGDVVDNCVNYHWTLGGALIEGGLRRAGCTVVPGGIGNSDLHLETIAGLGVTGIVAFPSFLEHLLGLAAERGLELPLRRAAVSGEVRRSDFRATLERDHGILVRERYGVSEVGTVAYECPAADGMHLRDDLLFETLDPETGEAVELDAPGLKELVVTDPSRLAMPIVRLRTGDLAEALVTEPCACGRTAPRLRRIVGRTGLIPRVKGMFVVPRHVQDVLAGANLHLRHQLRIEQPDGRDRLTILIEDRDGADLEALRPAFDAALRMRVEIERVEQLPDDAPVVDDRRVVT